MRKRVIRSLVFGAIAVVICSFVILTPIFMYSFYVIDTNKAYEDMQDNINHIKPIAQMSLSFRTSKMDRLFDESMNQLAYFSKSRILFMDIKGDVIWANDIMHPDKIADYSKKALESMTDKDKLKTIGLLNGLYSENTLTVGEYIENEFDQKSWIVFCSSPAPDFTTKYKVAFWEILTIELITLSFAGIFLFMFSRNITKPLGRINNTLKEFAKGNFDRRVKYDVDNEIGELASNINQMADAITNLEKMRSDFVSDITHELRTPMTSISGFIEGILDGTISENDRDKYLRIALSESKRLSKLISELLSLTRIEDQVKKLSPTEFDVEELSKIVLLKFEDVITSRSINVNFDMEGDEFIVRADKDKIIQVLTNLFHNAVKFTPDEGNISILLQKSGEKCVISVINSGYGIEPDKLNFIWERFYKVDNSRSSDRSGIGIGLYIVKKIIDAHDEKIMVSSTVNDNTCFKFTLPLA